MKKKSLAMKKLFPVLGFTIGKVTKEELRNKGYYVEEPYSNEFVCKARGFYFWDHDGDGLFEDIYASAAEELPEAWENKFGLCWRLSYNGWMEALKALDFELKIIEEPQVKVIGDGPEQLFAEVVATTKEKDLSIELSFAWGNDFDEGATLDSPRSLHSITLTTVFD